MRLARILELTHNIASTHNSIEGLGSLHDLSLFKQTAIAHDKHFRCYVSSDIRLAPFWKLST